jgi:uncharacterized membrane protein
VGAAVAWSAVLDILTTPAALPRDWSFVRFASHLLVAFGVVVGVTAFSLQTRMHALVGRLFRPVAGS